jgi:hypothetical protein
LHEGRKLFVFESLRWFGMGDAIRSMYALAGFVLAFHGQAQPWFPDGALWHHEYFNGAFTGYVRMEVDGDTLLAGQEARVLKRTVVAASFDGGPQAVWPFLTWAAYEESGIVRIWVPSQQAFDTLWNMNAVPGDQWRLGAMTEPILCDSESFVVVADTGHLTFSGVDLRWLAVDLHYIWDGTEWDVQRDTIIERIGPTLMYFTPHDHCNGQLDGAEGLDLRCYSDAEVSYSRIAPWSCETLLGVPTESAPLPARLVPISGGCSVQLSVEGVTAQLDLFDGTGRHLRQVSVRHGDLIQCGTAGFLTYRFIDATGRVLGAGALIVD